PRYPVTCVTSPSAMSDGHADGLNPASGAFINRQTTHIVTTLPTIASVVKVIVSMLARTRPVVIRYAAKNTDAAAASMSPPTSPIPTPPPPGLSMSPPTMTMQPPSASTRPIQNVSLGRSRNSSHVPRPTSTGELLVSTIAVVADVLSTAVLKNARSIAKNAPTAISRGATATSMGRALQPRPARDRTPK